MLLANFLVGIAIVCQPHIVTKALSVKDDEALWTYLKTGIAVATTFAAVLVVGLYARVSLPAVAQIDRVMPHLRGRHLLPPAAAGGLHRAAGRRPLHPGGPAAGAVGHPRRGPLPAPGAHLRGEGDAGARARAAMKVARLGLFGIAGLTYYLAVQQITDPTGGSVAIFAQLGVYCVFSSAFAPMLFGIFVEDVSPRLAAASAGTAVPPTWACGPWRSPASPTTPRCSRPARWSPASP